MENVPFASSCNLLALSLTRYCFFCVYRRRQTRLSQTLHNTAINLDVVFDRQSMQSEIITQTKQGSLGSLRSKRTREEICTVPWRCPTWKSFGKPQASCRGLDRAVAPNEVIEGILTMHRLANCSIAREIQTC